MRIAIAILAAATSLSSIPLIAQQDDASTPGNDSAKVTYAPTAGGFGDQAASHAWEMSAVNGELEGKLDSRAAKVGDRVVLKTTEKVQTSDGTIIPRGSRLVGHVTEVQPFDIEVCPGRIAIAFDHAELKNGQSIAIYTLIRGVSPFTNAAAADATNNDQMMDLPVGGGGITNDQKIRGGPGSGGNPEAVGGIAGGTLNRTGDASERDPNLGAMASTAQDGNDGLSADTGAHAVAATRARPHPTNIPGVMLAGNSSSSGVLLAPLKNIQFESGTLIQLGVATGK